MIIFFSLFQRRRKSYGVFYFHKKLLPCDFLWFCLVLLKKWIQVLVVLMFGVFTKMIPWTFLFKVERIHYFFCSLTYLLVHQRLLSPRRRFSVLFVSSNSLLNAIARFISWCSLSKGVFRIRLAETIPSVGISFCWNSVFGSCGDGRGGKKRKKNKKRDKHFP